MFKKIVYLLFFTVFLSILFILPNNAYAKEYVVNFEWNDSKDKWEHNSISDSKYVIIDGYRAGIFSQREGSVQLSVGEAKYGNDYMTVFNDLTIENNKTKTYTANLSDIYINSKDTIKFNVSFKDSVDNNGGNSGNTPITNVKEPSNIYFNIEGTSVFANVDKNTTTKAYNSYGQRIDDGSLYSQDGGLIQLDLNYKLDNMESIYLISEDVDSGKQSNKAYATYKNTSSQKERFTVTINYLDELGRTIYPSKDVYDIYEDSDYTEKAININDYTLSDSQTKTIRVNNENKTINFNYKYTPKIKTQVIVKYVDENNKELSKNKTINNYFVGDKYTEKAININGYTLTSNSSQTITLGNTNNNIIFKYKKIPDAKSDITIKYVDEKGKSISKDKIIKNKNVNSKHTEKAININGYTLTNSSSQTITVNKNKNIITFKYKKITKANITIKYVDEKGKSINKNKIIKNKNVNSKHTEKAINISGYTLNGKNNQTVTVSYKGNTITFKYKRNKTANITVKYVNSKGKSISKNKVIKNKKVDSYFTENYKKIKGYKLVGKTSQKVKISNKGNTIIFKYK